MKKIRISREFKIGFFGVAMIALLYWGINFLKGSDIFSTSHKYYAVYDRVNGLRTSSAIVIKGFKVGTISDMTYDPAHSDKVVVEFEIRSKYKIPVDSKAMVFSDGILGGKAIEIEPGRSHEYLHSGDTLYSEINKDILEVAGSEMDRLMTRVTAMMNELTTTLQSVNGILVDNRGNIDASLGNLAATTGNLNRLIANERKSIEEVIENLNTLSATLSDKGSSLVGHAEVVADSLRTQLPVLLDRITLTVDNLNEVVTKINHGDGSAALLINDKQLYESLAESTTNLAALLEDIKQNPKRYINISVFGGRNRE